MQPRRHGMTLIELLVVIAIIGILAGLLLPAILQARSGGRKAQCASNLKQLAQAVQTFHHRHDCLPVYWGPMKGGGGQKFGGWLLHILPDMDQQSYYDLVPASTTSGSTWGVTKTDYVSFSPPRWLPAIPASPDFVEGTWQYVAVGTAVVNGASTTLYEWQFVGRVGDPGLPAREDKITKHTYGWIPTSSAGVAAEYLNLARQSTLPCLTDADDPGQVRSQAIPVSAGTTSLDNMQLTNYMANAHVFTKFNGPRTTGISAVAGLFPAPLYRTTGTAPSVTSPWHHGISTTTGPIGRSFTNVTDGLTNTILFGEGMRQCDNVAQYRAAFFPSGNPMNEHGFGIECQWRKPDGTIQPASSSLPSYGNTLMFQSLPDLKMANPLRLQTLHGPYLMVAMCDGSVRAISSLVSRREPVAANACGRENFGSVYYNSSSRGGNASPTPNSPVGDGIWDMLMVPADPPGNVLANTGEVGREK
jgi:prepilin-type N-terminal cleavage/methylation domain-containing protein